MQIKQIKISNFSSYVGENTIDLSTNEQQNIVLIGGNNGAGKTSLFTAIKLALYGPQCFRFQDRNNQYTARIKELINHDAFMMKEVKAFVEIEIVLPTDRVDTLYTLRREWSYNDRRLLEAYTVFDNGTPLNSKDQDFFQNYLFAIIPPNMFDFFFFDGEEIGEFFSTPNYNNYIKNAVLTLCGYDTFQLIKRFCDSYIADEDESEKHEQIRRNLKQSELTCLSLEEEIADLTNKISIVEDTIERLTSEKQALKNKFEKSGGLTEKDREKIKKQQQIQDGVKINNSKKIRNFVEGLMPVFITRDLAHAAQTQLNGEQEVQRYQTVTQQLSEDLLCQILKDMPSRQQVSAPEELAEIISRKIAEELRPALDLERFKYIHDLSQEQENQVVSTLVQLKGFDPQNIIDACRDKKKASEKYELLSRQFRESMPEVDANTYFTNMNSLIADIAQYEETKKAYVLRSKTAEEELGEEQKRNKSIKDELKVISRNQTAYLYTERMGQMMQAIIQDAVHAKFKQVEKLALEMFRKIIHKNDFIELIELDNNFTINIYKKQIYSVHELAILLQNIGTEDLTKRLGLTGIQKALDHFHLETIQELKSYLVKHHAGLQINIDEDEPIHLYKKMELNQLSKGEKQVFILSLYWAIIKTSGQTVPFVIDTPYARIDMEHREQIAKLFFPQISNQVIILSTDEEVVGQYKDALASYTAHKYLLDYDTKKGCTIFRPGYFEEVTA